MFRDDCSPDADVQHQFEAESKRFSPEAINFLAASVTTLLPRRKDSVSTTPYPDLLAPSTELLLRSDVEAQDVVAFAEVMTSENDQSKANLLGLILRLIDTFAVMHSGSHAFIEAFQPLLDVLKASKSVKLSTGLQVGAGVSLPLHKTLAHLTASSDFDHSDTHKDAQPRHHFKAAAHLAIP